MHQAQEKGIEVPDSFEGWADYFPRYTVLPWLKGKAHKRVQVMRDYLRIAFDRMPIAKVDSSTLVRVLQKSISYPARWRLDHDVYGLRAVSLDSPGAPFNTDRVPSCLALPQHPSPLRSHRQVRVGGPRRPLPQHSSPSRQDDDATVGIARIRFF